MVFCSLKKYSINLAKDFRICDPLTFNYFSSYRPQKLQVWLCTMWAPPLERRPLFWFTPTLPIRCTKWSEPWMIDTCLCFHWVIEEARIEYFFAIRDVFLTLTTLQNFSLFPNRSVHRVRFRESTKSNRCRNTRDHLYLPWVRQMQDESWWQLRPLCVEK